MKGKKIAILGASYLQKPLVEKAKEMGLETHVFAWKEGNIVENICDFYYDISILEKDIILKKCAEIQIDGIAAIATDIAMLTVNYVASKLGLVGNTLEATMLSTDKFMMRSALSNAGVKCPKFEFYKSSTYSNSYNFNFPVIVKPTDRSGSRGVTKVEHIEDLSSAIEKAIENSIKGEAIVEEFIQGREFSIEGISVNGKHEIIAVTDKVTTGTPYFVEVEHHQPAQISTSQYKKINTLVPIVLDALKLKNGASHTELFINDKEELLISEAAGRMGGDWIGSHITPSTTGFDYLRAVLLISLGYKDIKACKGEKSAEFSGVFFKTPNSGIVQSTNLNTECSKFIKDYFQMLRKGDKVENILDSSSKRAAILFYEHSMKLETKTLNSFLSYTVK
jgi:biotin carboxylase